MSCGHPISRQATVNGISIEYDLHRSPRRRKSISLIVEDGRFRVLAPKRTALKQIHALLEHRSDWIQERLTASDPLRLRDQLKPGGQLPLFGQSMPVEAGSGPFDFDGRCFQFDPQRGDQAAAAERWFREFARAEFTAYARRWAERIGVTPTRIQVRDQKTRWGSASSTGTLSFNWRLIFARPEIVEYVVVHELCHLVQPNHSPAYWRLVASHLPDYQQRRQALKDAANGLSW